MVFKIIILVIGFFLSSSGIIFIKLGTLDPVLFASCRLLITTILFLPFFIRDLQKYKLKFPYKEIFPALIPGVFLGIHFLTWTYGARMTPAANAALIVNMLPVFMPIYSYFLIGEKIRLHEIIATGLALLGILYLGSTDFKLEANYFKGDVICFISMLSYVTYVAIGRKNKKRISLWLYIVPLYFSGGLFSLIVYFCKGGGGIPEGNYLKEIISLAGVVLLPTILGHTIINYSLKYIKAQVVSILNLLQAVFGAIYGYLFFKEIPSNAFYPAGMTIIFAVLIVIFASKYKKRKPKLP